LRYFISYKYTGASQPSPTAAATAVPVLAVQPTLSPTIESPGGSVGPASTPAATVPPQDSISASEPEKPVLLQIESVLGADVVSDGSALRLQGFADPEATLTVDGEIVALDFDGKFVYDVPVTGTEQTVEVIAVAPSGERKVQIITVSPGNCPIIEYGCALVVDIGGELRVWYFSGETDVFGGFLSGSDSGEVACIMSVRGKLSVEVERLPEGGTSTGERDCPDDGNNDNIRSCTALSGEFWFAVGSGWCERKTWKSWESRWWGDSWCYTYGAQIGLNYIDPSPAVEDNWFYTTNVDWE
jgi:hypothetical protein